MCKISSTRVTNGGASIWLGPAHANPIKKQSLFFRILLADASGDTGRGVLTVSIMTNKDVTNFLGRYTCVSSYGPSVYSFSRLNTKAMGSMVLLLGQLHKILRRF